MEIGINTNILETNVLNLGVVIGVVIYLGGDVLSSLLKARKENILKNLNAAEEKYQQTLLALEEAKTKLALAQDKTKEIKDAFERSTSSSCTLLASTLTRDWDRLKEFETEAYEMEKNKRRKKYASECVQIVVNDAIGKVQKLLSTQVAQQKLIDQNIAVLVKFNGSK